MKHNDPYLEAMRYVDNANATLKLAGKDGKFYVDEKYVHTACGTAYIGVLKALDFLFDIKNVPKKRGRKAIEYYRTVLSGIDRKLLLNLNSAYNVLHLQGYYEGEKGIKVIEAGFDYAISIIDALKPYSKNGVAK
jgi:hypothetical protein